MKRTEEEQKVPVCLHYTCRKKKTILLGTFAGIPLTYCRNHVPTGKHFIEKIGKIRTMYWRNKHEQRKNKKE